METDMTKLTTPRGFTVRPRKANEPVDSGRGNYVVEENGGAVVACASRDAGVRLALRVVLDACPAPGAKIAMRTIRKWG